MPKKKAKAPTAPPKKGKKKYSKPALIKHGVLSIVEGD
jgi:hypothetical protein